MEWKLRGASGFRTKARSTIERDVSGWRRRFAVDTPMRLTSQPFGNSCVKRHLPDAQQAAGDLGSRKPLGMLKQQVKHGAVHIRYTQQELYLMGRVTPHQPMGQPQKHVSHAQMAEILARNAKPKVEVVVQREPLKWKDPVKTGPHSAYIESVCGRFTVTKTPHELGWNYCAHDRSTKDKPIPGEAEGMATCLGCKGTKEEAIALCEAVR